MYFTLKSETFPWVSGAKKVLPLDFLDRVGPRTGRFAIERIFIEAALNITTVAANTIVGADMAGFVKRLRISDAIGNRVYLTGAKLRLFEHLEMLDGAPADPTTHPASTTQVDTSNLIINFSQEQTARRRYDYALPVDDLLNGGVCELEMPASTDIFQTGAGATIVSGSYTLYFLCREEWDVEFHMRDQREEVPLTAQTVGYIPSGGRILRFAALYKEAQGGGASVATILDSTIDAFKEVVTTRNAKKQIFLARGPTLTAQDPFFNDKCYPIVFPRRDSKVSDFLLIPGQLLVRLNSTLALPTDIVMHHIAPKDERMMRAAAQANGIDGSTIRVKTQGKTAADQNLWGPLASFMPLKAPRPSR